MLAHDPRGGFGEHNQLRRQALRDVPYGARALCEVDGRRLPHSEVLIALVDVAFEQLQSDGFLRIQGARDHGRQIDLIGLGKLHLIPVERLQTGFREEAAALCEFFGKSCLADADRRSEPGRKAPRV